MGIFNKRPAVPLPPCPSDILAGLVATRMLSSPERVIFSRGNRSSDDLQNKAMWVDEKSGVTVRASRLNSAWDYDSSEGRLVEFSRGGVALAPSRRGRQELLETLARCAAHQRRAELAQRQYAGDMAACDAIEDIFK